MLLVLGSNTRVFAAVLEKAQEILRRTFGMELVELHRGTDDGEDDQTTGTGLKKKGVALPGCVHSRAVVFMPCSPSYLYWDKELYPTIYPRPGDHRTSLSIGCGNHRRRIR